MRVIIAEDELMLSLALEDALINQGHTVTGEAVRRDVAIKLAAPSVKGLVASILTRIP